jgi:hypothetical protein
MSQFFATRGTIQYIDVGYDVTEAGFENALALAADYARQTPEVQPLLRLNARPS